MFAKFERATQNYAFSIYLDPGDDVFLRHVDEMSPSELCALGRPILVLRDFDTLNLSIEGTN